MFQVPIAPNIALNRVERRGRKTPKNRFSQNIWNYLQEQKYLQEQNRFLHTPPPLLTVSWTVVEESQESAQAHINYGASSLGPTTCFRKAPFLVWVLWCRMSYCSLWTCFMFLWQLLRTCLWWLSYFGWLLASILYNVSLWICLLCSYS